MKKLLFMLLTMFLLLAACSSEDAIEDVEETKQEVQTEKVENEETIELVTDEIEEEPIEVNDEESSIESEDELQEQPSNTITESELKSVIEYSGIGEGDRFVSASIINNEIKVTIELAKDDIFPADQMAVTNYSQLSGELLGLEGWDVLTVTYPNVGTISMHRNEKETNEFGYSYFPTLMIEEKLIN